MPKPPERLATLLSRVRACRVCEQHLPLAPRPVLSLGPKAVLLIVGQAPGLRVHQTGVPWNDPSGDRLRLWLDVTREVFYDTRRVAIMPTGFCYPGTGARGDLPPRPECAPLWHPLLRAALPEVRLTLLIGTYAQAYYLGTNRRATLADTVRAFRDYLPAFFPLPHPSPRNQLWFKRHPWLQTEVIPGLREAVRRLLV